MKFKRTKRVTSNECRRGKAIEDCRGANEEKYRCMSPPKPKEISHILQMVRSGQEMVLRRLGFNERILTAWGDEINKGAHSEKCTTLIHY